jgi:rhodanese-related sulfurtransferase
MKKKQQKLWMIVLGLILIATAASAGALHASEPVVQTETTADWKFHDIVDIDFVKPYITIPKPENVLVIDSRPREAKFDKGHIPTAISIPDASFEKMTHLLPQDKNTLMIFYCEGLECKLSHKSAKKAEALGYTQVKVYAEGYPGWIKDKENYAEVPVAFVKTAMDDKAEMVLVDSRPKEGKYDQGHIPTAISIPDTSFEKMTHLLPEKKDTLLVFYCGGFDCKLSHKSASKAIKMGYSQVKVFSAGYPAWQEMVAKTENTSTVAQVSQAKKGALEGAIETAAFEKIISENPSSVLLIDVRDPDEFAKGSIKTAVNIPVDKLENQVKTLPSDKPIVFVCGTGARSGEAFYMLKDLRPELKDVFYVEAEIKFGSDGTCKITETKKG